MRRKTRRRIRKSLLTLESSGLASVSRRALRRRRKRRRLKARQPKKPLLPLKRKKKTPRKGQEQ